MSDIRGTLFNITRNVTKTSGDLIKTTKLTVNLTGEQDNLKNLYIEIGKKVHEIYLYGGTLGKFFDEKYRELVACEAKIDALKEQINQIKGTRECPTCKKTVDRTAEFCSKCGTRMDAVAAPISPGNTAASPPSDIPVPPPPSDIPLSPPSSDIPVPPPPIPPLAAQSQSAPPAKRTCHICGSVNEADTKFCLTCGRIL